MRICCVGDGGSIHTQRWVNYFARKSHEVHLICWTLLPGYDENIHTHSLTRLPPRKWTRYVSALLWIFQTWRLIKKIKPDVVDGHFITSYGFLAACSRFHPLVVSAWGSDVLVLPKRNFLFKAITKYALERADVVTCDAEHLKTALMELGTEPQKISVVYFGTDTDKFKPAQRNRGLEQALGIVDSPTVISLRSLEPIYDIDVLINAIPLVLKEVPEARFIIGGRGSQEAELKELARSLGVLESIKFVGFIRNEEIPQYLTSSDVYVSTSSSDAGLSAATAEAMACELPVVVTDFGDNRRWVKDGENGFVVPLRDPRALAERIIYLLKNEDARMEFGRKNREIIKEKNDYSKEMEKTERIYEEAIRRYKS
jgi:glycosyltransferase involved in cell wall biosynthesis